MKKQQQKLALSRETVLRLSDTSLRRVNGGARIHIPIGYADNTEPIYSWSDDTMS